MHFNYKLKCATISPVEMKVMGDFIIGYFSESSSMYEL